jgi:hypothetical protein
MARPPFEMLRAAFWLLAGLVAVEMFASLAAIGGCIWTIMIERQEPFGACSSIGAQVREVWSEALAAILALLLASRTGNGPPTKPPDDMEG